MATKQLQKIYESQYLEGEWPGPWWYQQLKPFITTREEAVAAFVPNNTNSLLDLGCGEGNLLKMVQPKVKRSIGLDLLLHRLNLAKNKLKGELSNGRVQLQVHDFDQALPFRDGMFEVVTCVSVLEYLIDPYQFADEVARVIKKRGLFIIEVPNLAYFMERLRLLTGHLVGVANAPGWQGGRLHHFTFDTLTHLLESRGFEVENRSASGLLPQLRSLHPSLLSSDIILVCRKK